MCDVEHFCTRWWRGGRGFAKFGGVCVIWTKLKVHLTSNWCWFRIAGAQTSICGCWLHDLLLGSWFLFESYAWFNYCCYVGEETLWLCDPHERMTKTARHFPLQAPPYPYSKWVPLAQDEEEDEDGNGQLGLSNGKNHLK